MVLNHSILFFPEEMFWYRFIFLATSVALSNVKNSLLRGRLGPVSSITFILPQQ